MIYNSIYFSATEVLQNLQPFYYKKEAVTL